MSLNCSQRCELLTFPTYAKFEKKEIINDNYQFEKKRKLSMISKET